MGTTGGEIYYWRVKAIYECDSSAFSPISVFRTQLEICNTYLSVNLPVAFGAPDTLFDTIYVVDSFTISDANLLNVFIDNGNIRNFKDVTLTSPTGTEVLIAAPSCSLGQQEDLDASFDEAAAEIVFCPRNGVLTKSHGGYISFGSPLGNTLDALNGENMAGDWVFSFINRDFVGPVSGTLDSWDLELCYAKTNVQSPTVTLDTFKLDQGQDSVITAAFLQATDADTADELTFILTSVPENGVLKLSGTALEITDIFTQQDIDSNRLNYDHDNSTNFTDHFQFLVHDNDGGGITTVQTMVINIVPTFVIDAGNNRTICPDASTTLGGATVAAGGIPPYEYLWLPDSLTVENPIVAPDSSTTFYLQTTDFRGIERLDSITIFVGDTTQLIFSYCPSDMISCSPVTAFLPPRVLDNCLTTTIDRAIGRNNLFQLDYTGIHLHRY